MVAPLARVDTEPGDLSVSSTDWLARPTGPAPLAPTRPAPVAAATGPASRSGMIDFDFGSLRLDLEHSTPAHSEPAALAAAAPVASAFGSASQHSRLGDTATVAGDGADALSTKLALAEAFSAIGDADSARSMAREVVGEASGALKARAERFLSSIH